MPAAIFDAIKPLSEKPRLDRCPCGANQNQNESFDGLLWHLWLKTSFRGGAEPLPGGPPLQWQSRCNAANSEWDGLWRWLLHEAQAQPRGRNRVAKSERRIRQVQKAAKEAEKALQERNRRVDCWGSRGYIRVWWIWLRKMPIHGPGT